MTKNFIFLCFFNLHTIVQTRQERTTIAIIFLEDENRNKTKNNPLFLTRCVCETVVAIPETVAVFANIIDLFTEIT